MRWYRGSQGFSQDRSVSGCRQQVGLPFVGLTAHRSAWDITRLVVRASAVVICAGRPQIPHARRTCMRDMGGAASDPGDMRAGECRSSATRCVRTLVAV